MRCNQPLCFGLQISIQKLCCRLLVLIPICSLYYSHFFHEEILPVVCDHCILWIELPEGNDSILWLHNIHHRPLVLWYSISVVCQWKYVKGKLLEILFYHVPETAVLHRHHLIHLCKLCNVSLDVGSVIMVLGWLIPCVVKNIMMGWCAHKFCLLMG